LDKCNREREDPNKTATNIGLALWRQDVGAISSRSLFTGSSSVML